MPRIIRTILRHFRAARRLTLTVHPDTGRVTLSPSLLACLQLRESGTHILLTRLSQHPLIAFTVSPPDIPAQSMAPLQQDTETAAVYFIPAPTNAAAILCNYNLPHDQPATFTVRPAKLPDGTNYYTLIPQAK
ncbi:MAG: hypothetical protein ACI4OZ_09200 [Akkermansia sp.]